MYDIKSLIGQRIKTIRKNKGYTQEKLSELIGIEPQSMSYMENGKFAPTPDTLQKLATALDVQPYEFYYFDTVSDFEMKEVINKVIKKDRNLLKMFYTVCKNVEY